MQLIQPPSFAKYLYHRSIFLAGGISKCSNWQGEVINALWAEPVTLINPRCANFIDPTDIGEAGPQISWERAHLRAALQIVFWFPEESVCPIALFELGAALERNQELFIGCHPNYSRRVDLEVQIELVKPKYIISNDLQYLIKWVKNW